MENKTPINRPDLKYEYAFHTWGGFYAECNKHGYKSGTYIFSTKEERDALIKKLKTESNLCKFGMLCIHKFEGYNCRIPPKLCRVFRYNDEIYYHENQFNWTAEYSGLEYMIEWKWTALTYGDVYDTNGKLIRGPWLCDEEDEFDKNVKIIQEWIEGSVNVNIDYTQH